MESLWSDLARLALLLALPIAVALVGQRADAGEAAKRVKRRGFRWTWLPGRNASRSRS